MRRFDWAGLMRAGMGRREAGGLGLLPQDFWALTPGELRLMLGIEAAEAPLDRGALAALMRAFPDGNGGGDGGSGEPGRTGGGA
ncbi:MAG: rcc01693 family protein [Gemmobacter sp.]